MLLKSMDGVENYLKFTGETGEDFEGGWLPTLDTNLKVTKENKVLFKMYEKETCSKQTIHKKSAMGENIKSQILSQDLIRRLLNTSEDLSNEYREHVVDEYGKKILNSGYTREQAIRILVNGIKGYENKRRRRIKEGEGLEQQPKNPDQEDTGRNSSPNQPGSKERKTMPTPTPSPVENNQGETRRARMILSRLKSR